MMQGGDVNMMAGCFAQRLPPDAVQQCANNCDACFGKLDPNNYSCKIAQGALSIIGIDSTKIAKPVDKAVSTVKKWGKKLKNLF